MKFDRWFDRHLKEHGRGAVTKLAKLLNISSDKITKMRRGIRQPQARELRAIESFFGAVAPLTGAQAANGTVFPSLVPVVGYVGIGAQLHLYAVASDEFERVVPPFQAKAKTVAVEIRGLCFGSTLNQWLAFFEDSQAPVTGALVGQLCVVSVENDGIFVRRIVRGATDRTTFDLVSEYGRPIRNASIQWAAPVNLFAPRGGRNV